MSKTKDIDSYDHQDSNRTNVPPIGLVSASTDPDSSPKQYTHDPHLDPELQWSGKSERSSFEVPTTSLHVHERIDPRTIISAFGKSKYQPSIFDSLEENRPIREAIEFYKHTNNWTNRLIAGDSLLVMNSLLEKENLAKQVQMVYVDPPYGIRYGSNFQPWLDHTKTSLTDDKDDNLTREPEQIRAFRDTWELGVHSYLSYLRDRLLLARELLSDTGSCFLQISEENVHRVGLLLDEIFGASNRIATIPFATTASRYTKTLPIVSDYLLWYCKDRKRVKFSPLYEKMTRQEMIEYFSWHAAVELEDGSSRSLTDLERFDPDSNLPKNAKLYRRVGLDSQGSGGKSSEKKESYEWNGQVFKPAHRRQWSISREGLDELNRLGRLVIATTGKSLAWKRYEDEVPGRMLTNLWPKQSFPQGKEKIYVVQTAAKIVRRCMLMTTDPGDLVLDPTCGGGTTAFVAEQWGRRWVTCDTSRIAIALTKQRLMTAVYDYYVLNNAKDGVKGDFQYKSVKRPRASTLAYSEPTPEVILRDQPLIDKDVVRVSGAFTMEAVPTPIVLSIDEVEQETVGPSDSSVARTAPTISQMQWRDELSQSGVRGRRGQVIKFTRLDPITGKYLHADGEVTTSNGKTTRVMVSFGSEHTPLEKRQVERALQEVQYFKPQPSILIFAAFQFDPEASKDIDETQWPGITILKVQMDSDLLTEDLKKKSRSSESFWLIGQPDVRVTKLAGEKQQYKVSVHGFDYYNALSGEVESGTDSQIAMWSLDTDYDGRSLFPRQVFFPMKSGSNSDWTPLKDALKGKIDLELIEAFYGTESIPFESGEHLRIGVKIVDDRGLESFRILNLDD